MKVSTKVNLAFGLAAALLVAVGLVAFRVVDRLNEVRAELDRCELQTSQIADAIRACRQTPQLMADHRARIADLQRLARGSEELQWADEAQRALAGPQPIPQATDRLDRLAAVYRSKITAAQERLLTICRWAEYGLIVILIDSVLIFILLGWCLNRWVFTPLRIMAGAVTELSAGNAHRQLSPIGDQEFFQIADGINKLGAELQTARANAEFNQRLINVGEACSHVTHNVRNLLGSIRSLAQHESNTTVVDPNARVGFNYIIAIANKLDHWVRDMHSTLSPVNPRVTATHVEPIVHDAIAMLEPQVSEKQLRVDYRADDDLPRVMIDSGLFEQAFLSVLSNAIQAAPAESEVNVQLTNGSAEFLAVIIADRGPGMTDEVRQRAFDPYFTTKRDSAGLGLTIAHAIMKRHGGKIEIESTPTTGTRVSLHVPVAAAR